MSTSLTIHTATHKALVVLTRGEKVIDSAENALAREHAAFLHVAVDEVLRDNSLTPRDLDAIAVTVGPGSYTGIRVGMSAAKGLCFALQKPLITINTLHAMALSSFLETSANGMLYCPMIDARRMEVFTGIYDSAMTILLHPQAMILNEYSLAKYANTTQIYFSGDGAQKAAMVINPANHLFKGGEISPAALASITFNKFQEADFTDLAYAKPLYLKEFHTTAQKQ